MIDVQSIEMYLSNVRQREPDSEQDEYIRESLKSAKREAVEGNNQLFAKTIWCYETILKLQNEYVLAFQRMKEKHFYSGWCSLEKAEKNLYFLERHFVQDARGGDPFSLNFIRKYVRQFQALFPYTLFISPAFMALKKECSICGKPVSIRNPCGHIIGEIYDGEMCGRVVTEFDLPEMSLVTNPEQKYSVVFMGKEKGWETIDHYNYSHVDYVIRGLRHPFSIWNMKWTTIERPHSDFPNLGRNDKCPCGSGKKYKRCCIKQGFIKCRHLQVQFSEPIPSDLPVFEDAGCVRNLETIFPN